jgi:hypothetical protein
MKSQIDTAAVESLRAFAISHGEVRFARLCTTALKGDLRAADLVAVALRNINETIGGEIDWQRPSQRTINAARIGVIRATNTTHPNGAIARSFQP